MSSKYKFAVGDLIRRNDFWDHKRRQAHHIYLVYKLGSYEASGYGSTAFRATVKAYSVMNIRTLKCEVIVSALEGRYDKVVLESPHTNLARSHPIS